ncbi:microtubule-associated protein TORTIFOLIA1-like [Punica granatum]|nr:microtubule-associated protein TORTIFOLIA1-like [Punica granatum]
MSSQGPKPSKPSKPHPHSSHSQPNSRAPNSSSSSSSVTSHLAMVELKQKILTSLSKLADRDTYQIAVSDLESTIQTISHDAIPMLLNCLFESSNDPKPAVKKESIRLLAFVCSSRGDTTFNHLTKIIAQLSRRLKDSDSGVRDACRDAIGALSAQYLKNEGVVGLFVKPLFEVMGDQNKAVQSGAAMCMAKMVECAVDPPVAAFQKMCPRICKLLNNPNFLAKAALLPVVSNLSQVGAISPQNFDSLLQGIQECLGSPDWAIRKAAAETLSALAMHSSHLITDGATSTLTALEGSRFDKIKPVRDSMLEALQLWKKILGKGDGGTDDQKSVSQESENPEPQEISEKNDANPSVRKEPSGKDSSPTEDSASRAKAGNIPDKAVVLLKRKTPVLTDKELNPEFFQKLETRGSGDLPVEVVVPRRYLNSSNTGNEEGSGPNVAELRGRFNRMGNNSNELQGSSMGKYHGMERGMNGKDWRLRAFDEDKVDANQRESTAALPKAECQSEGGSFSSNRGNWIAIQRQLLQLERQQTHLMSMLQDFMGGSHDSMVTLENRVRGLERVVEDMARDLSISSGRRGGSFSMGFDGATSRNLGKYNGFSDYSSGKFGRGAERFAQSEGTASGLRGRNLGWRSDISEGWDRDFPPYGSSRNGHSGARKALDGGRRAWDKEAAPVRHGEGPSARSVWQASKDEATLEAIRVAGEDGSSSRAARVAVPELTAEALEDDNVGRERDPVWAAWTNAMDALHVGDIDTAYAEVLSTGDDLLLVKLMDRSGPTVDQLSNEVATEVLHAVAQFLQEQNLFDVCLSWIQQLFEMVLENGPNSVPLPTEVKKELLFNLHETSSAIDPPDDWEGAAPDQLLLQLASAWGIDLQQFDK